MVALKAKVKQLSLNIASEIQPLQNFAVLKKVIADHKTADVKLPWGRHWIERGFKGELNSVRCWPCLFVDG